MTLARVGGPEQASVQATGRAILLGGGVLAVLLLIILLLQLRGIWLHYPFYITTGCESHAVYGVWKAQEGYPLYSWPDRDFYQLTLYNFAFYHVYAKALNLLGVRGPAILLYGRFLTVLFAFCGFLIQARLLCFLAGELMSRTVKAAILLVAFYTWFNSFFPGYYPISVRPDIAAAAVSTLGLYCFIRYAASSKAKWVFAAAVTWAAAWCFKQADVACIWGAGIYLVVSRRWSDAMVLAMTFGIPVGLVLLLGSAEYRWNILVAPTVNGLHLADGLQLFLRGLVLSLFSWTCVATLPLYLTRILPDGSEPKLKAVWQRMRPGAPLAPIMALVVVVICGGIPSFAALCKTGSSLNLMLEVFVVATTLSFILALRLAAILPAEIVRRFNLMLCLALLSMCAFPACQLVLHRIGPIVRATDADMARKEAFARFLQSLKKPLFIDDEIYSLPWYSSDNHFPAIKLDYIFYNDAVARGVISDGVQTLIKRHWFSTLYLPAGTPLYNEAIAAQYRPSPIPIEESSYLDCLGKEHNNCLLLTVP